MLHQFKCPSCSKPLYFPNFGDCCEDFVDGICTGCQYKYALFETEVTNFVSQVETRHNSNHNKQPDYNRSYQFRLKQPNGSIKAIQFSAPGQVEKISALPGDLLLLLYTMRGRKLEDLVRIENLTTNKNLLLFNPSTKALSKGFAAGVSTLVGSFVVAGVLNLPTNQLFLAATVPGAVGAFVYVGKRFSLRVRDRLELGRHYSEQQLLAQKYNLEQKLVELTQEQKANQKILQRLKALQQKMSDTDANMYARRITTVASGINVIEDQLDLVQNLLDGYTQLLKIIEIEYETSRLAEKLPSNFTSQVLTRLEELKAVEEKKQELSLRVDRTNYSCEV